MKHRSRADVKNPDVLVESAGWGWRSKILAAGGSSLSAKPVSSLASHRGREAAQQRMLEETAMADSEDWWGTVDADTLRCLTENGPMTPAELGKRLGISEDGATSLVSHLAREGRVRICLVESATLARRN
jgi:predicted HTH transcriptional regulator